MLNGRQSLLDHFLDRRLNVIRGRRDTHKFIHQVGFDQGVPPILLLLFDLLD